MLLATKLLGGQAARKAMKRAGKEFRATVATAMNKSAFDARDEVLDTLKRDLDRPTPFTVYKKAVFVRRAFPNRLRVIVEVNKRQASYLKWVVYGGTKKGNLNVPYKHARLNRYGNLPRGWGKPRHDRFWGTIKGTPGLWQRDGRDVRLLVAKEAKADYETKIPFHAIVVKTYRKNFPRQFQRALTRR